MQSCKQVRHMRVIWVQTDRGREEGQDTPEPKQQLGLKQNVYQDLIMSNLLLTFKLGLDPPYRPELKERYFFP